MIHINAKCKIKASKWFLKKKKWCK